MSVCCGTKTTTKTDTQLITGVKACCLLKGVAKARMRSIFLAIKFHLQADEANVQILAHSEQTPMPGRCCRRTRGGAGRISKPPLRALLNPHRFSLEQKGCGADCPQGLWDEAQLCVIAGSVESFQSGAAACPATGSHICVGFSRLLTAGCPTVTHHCTINSKGFPTREKVGGVWVVGAADGGNQVGVSTSWGEWTMWR